MKTKFRRICTPKLTIERFLYPSTLPKKNKYTSIPQTPTSRKDRKKSKAYRKLVDFLKQSTHRTSRKKKLAANKKGKGQLMIS